MADHSWAQQIHAFYGIPSKEQREVVLPGPATSTVMIPSASMVTATVQQVDPNSQFIRMRTPFAQTLELQAPAVLLGQLQGGDHVEFMIRKSEPAPKIKF
jgi:hypothetical protein